ncbi:MAG: DUF2330 domain-containing protein [Myxococcales bacterium]|nr:DUF2330 domain-containing protein [Myxococcales bacterium]
MQVASYTVIGLCLFASILASPSNEAEACGGCVAPPGTFSSVQSHRMVVKLGLEESILWDQFIYTGAPEEFAWILPVPSADTVVELADSEFIDVIDQESSPIILASQCAAEEGAGCSGPFGNGGPFISPADSVEVHRREVVGPYETAVIGADDPFAIYAWLGEEGYAFPESGRPTLDHYIARGSSFVVLRLRPGQEVSAMQPVRVRFRGYMGQFPLKMIALGVTDSVELSLWVIAEERYEPKNFGSSRMNPNDIAWDWDRGASNYQDAFEQAIEKAGGNVWMTEYSQPLDDSALGDALFQEAPADLAMATAGMHYPVLTRLRTKLSADALSEDLVLGPADDQSSVPREIAAALNSEDCAGPIAAGLLPTPRDGRAQALFWVILAGLGLWVRRRSTPRRLILG